MLSHPLYVVSTASSINKNCQVSHASNKCVSIIQRIWLRWRKKDTVNKRKKKEIQRGKERVGKMEKYSWWLHINEWKFLLFPVTFGMSESYFTHVLWRLTSHWFHGEDWPFCALQKTIHCLQDHLQLASMCYHSELYQLSISTNSFSIHKIHSRLQYNWPSLKYFMFKSVDFEVIDEYLF
jgi:hypothetical protein